MGEVKVLTAHQTLLLEMLKDFDAVCRKHHISYQLFAGTALGAVRHHGFIPWDDDVDVILMRSEYDRLLTEAAGDFDPERYYVQRENSAHWPMQFSKLRNLRRPRRSLQRRSMRAAMRRTARRKKCSCSFAACCRAGRWKRSVYAEETTGPHCFIRFWRPENGMKKICSRVSG